MNDKYRLEIAFLILLLIFLVFFSLGTSAIVTGDGAHYYAALVGLSTNGSPEITEQIRSAVQLKLGVNPDFLIAVSKEGEKYPAHFFAYSLLSAPAYFLLSLLGEDTLKAFQVTNSVLVFAATYFVLRKSQQSRLVRWGVVFGFLASTGMLYLKWTHPEIFSASFLLVGIFLFLDKKHAAASFFIGVSSLQNPSLAFVIIPVIFDQLLYGLRAGVVGRHWKILQGLVIASAYGSIALLPGIWNYFKFGYASPIVHLGYIDTSLISWLRFYSFVFDLNVGLIVGLPMFLWMFPLIVGSKVFAAVKNGDRIFFREDLLLIGFVLAVTPTLAQLNWNSGGNVFSRYASWAGMLPLVWCAVSWSRISAMPWLVAPALLLQLGLVYWVNFATPRLNGSWVEMRPWVGEVWKINPHLYNPVPEIFYENIYKEEKKFVPPVLAYGEEGEILKILSRKNSLLDIGMDVCDGGFLSAIDAAESSRPQISKSEQLFYYVTGRLACVESKMVTLLRFGEGGKADVFESGWFAKEAGGMWSSGSDAEIRVPLRMDFGDVATVLIKGDAFIPSPSYTQRVQLKIGNSIVKNAVFTTDNANFNMVFRISSTDLNSDGALDLQFHFLNPVSPLSMDISSDERVLGIYLKSVKISYFPKNPH